MNKKTDDDSQLFRDSVKNIRPLATQDKTPLQRRKNEGNLTYRQQKAQMQQPRLHTSLSIQDKITAEEIIAYQQPGLSTKQYLSLKNGQLPIDDELDLHGYTLDSALLALDVFFNKALEYQYRCLRIVHGKGRDKALLKNATFAFLQSQINILAYHSAPARLGGAGATLVLLART